MGTRLCLLKRGLLVMPPGSQAEVIARQIPHHPRHIIGCALPVPISSHLDVNMRAAGVRTVL